MTKTLATLPSMPTSRTRPTSKCACGCGELTQRTFTPGHDSRLKGLMIRVVRNVMTLEDVADWGGEDARKAVEKGLKDKALMKRWNITVTTAAETKTA